MRIIPGINGATIIDDTYNSSPVAVEEALSTLKAIEAKGKKIAVLGDMLELGMYTEREHVRVGTYAKECVDVIVTIGLRAEDFITGAVAAGMDKNMTHMYPEPTAAMNYLKKHVGEHDVVLVKGSQGMRLERIVQVLMKDPEQAKELLVRQEKEWEHR
jgi:UDP-N-acetylmuramoyl-tripeptide--D-alanyl-D-alanine ligase